MAPKGNNGPGRSPRPACAAQWLLTACLASGCALTPTGERAKEVPVKTFAPVEQVASQDTDRPGYYTVKRGDTLSGIGSRVGRSSAEIMRWNELSTTVIEPGQVLRIAPLGPAADANDMRSGDASASGPAQPGSATACHADMTWAWPVKGRVLSPFDESGLKGLELEGRSGDAVHAAADGRVIYAGDGLRGYGNLLIVKHNDRCISAYGHNRALLVKVDQAVRRGQKIAEMGSTDAPHVQLYFSIRKDGKPVDPLVLLPSRGRAPS
jgi:lipoprotein NlpD